MFINAEVRCLHTMVDSYKYSSYTATECVCMCVYLDVCVRYLQLPGA
jgi:hypothetical protein